MVYFASVAFIAALFSGLAAAASNSSCTIDASSVDLSTRNSWCNAQYTACNTLCGHDVDSNTCSGSTLNYTCTCSNGQTPNVTEYKDTLPYYICTEAVDECVADHPDDADGQSDCRTSCSCGSKNLTSVVVSSTSSAAASTAAATSTGSAAASATSASVTTASKAAAATVIAERLSQGIVAAGVIAAFGFAL